MALATADCHSQIDPVVWFGWEIVVYHVVLSWFADAVENSELVESIFPVGLE